jgi:hypothetical protein
VPSGSVGSPPCHSNRFRGALDHAGYGVPRRPTADGSRRPGIHRPPLVCTCALATGGARARHMALPPTSPGCEVCRRHGASSQHGSPCAPALCPNRPRPRSAGTKAFRKSGDAKHFVWAVQWNTNGAKPQSGHLAGTQSTSPGMCKGTNQGCDE